MMVGYLSPLLKVLFIRIQDGAIFDKVFELITFLEILMIWRYFGCDMAPLQGVCLRQVYCFLEATGVITTLGHKHDASN